MKKKVDPRVRQLVESCVDARERAFLVLVGDRGREQVVSLHYLLCKLCPRKPSVLWCYKKDLGFSSHRKKRQKQLQKKISRGVYDPNVDDPFELFVSSTDIRYVYYKDTQQILGQTFGMCVLQDYEALTPNNLCRTVETVQGGGLICLLLHSFASLNQLYALAMDIHSRYKTQAFSEVHPRYTERFLLSLVSCRRCLILDDELNILPINGGPHLGAAPDPEILMQQQEERQQLQLIKEKVQHAPPLDALVRLCATTDQANAVLAFLDCLCSCRSFRSHAETAPAGKTPSAANAGGSYQTVALTAGRGRGKSAALGLAIAAAVSLGVSSIFVCAPAVENVQTLFEFVQKGLVATGLREQLDFQVTLEVVGAAARVSAAADVSGGAASGLYQRQTVKAITKVDVYKQHRQRIQFVFPSEHEALRQAELLVVDEAASIPLPIVKKLLGESAGPYLVLLSSTINGYEGTGRSLSLKLLSDLRRGSKGAPGQEARGPPPRQLKELSLRTPIRYASGDAVEQWLHDLLCLDATTAPPLDPEKGLPSPKSCSLYLVNRDALFSYHPASEAFLQRLQGLFVSSHYKNSPNDLQLLADAPAHLVFAFMQTVDDQQDSLPDVFCAIQVAIEGALSRGAIREALGRGLRPAGDLLPWTLAQAFGDEDVGILSGARIVRIAVHPSLQRMGFGSAALQQLVDFFEGRGLALQEPPEFRSFFQGRSETERQQRDKSKKAKVSKVDGDIEDLDAEVGTSEGEESAEDEETDAEAAEERKAAGRLKGASAKAKKTSKSAGATAVAFSEITSEQFKPRVTPPLLCPCSRSRPPFSVDYFGTAFGLTDQLLRFWSRRGFVPVYLRQQPNDVTGEHSCIMLRPAAAAPPEGFGAAAADGSTRREESHKRGLFGGLDAVAETNQAADGQWVHLFAVDFRRRFVELTGGPFRHMPISLALATASEGAKGQQQEGKLPPLNAKTLMEFFTLHDLGRLQKYSQQLADISLVTDLVPLLCSLYFGGRLRDVRLSFLQEAALLGMGGQRRQPDSLAAEFSVPITQILALFNKAMVKIHQHLRGLLEAEEALAFAAASTRRVAVKQGEAVGGVDAQGPLAEEQQADADKVLKQQKQQLKKIKEALGHDALEKYSVSEISKEDIVGVTGGREVSGSISVRKESKVPSAEDQKESKTHKSKKFKNMAF
ncbi:RNA cytidine acetyltransferase [Cyclospora cayetanensis]|uniref:RNA cytidine acetyltransferase n=1 Tax=Cyclospora cayetanensis TaxID=88456 RepID=A0A6P6S329_9EIME|nr:RNA cytidine acetyltransferase [Cyclospora cayetanensis]